MSALSFPDAANLCARRGCHNPSPRGRYCSPTCYEAARIPTLCPCGVEHLALPDAVTQRCRECRRHRRYARQAVSA